MLVRTKLKEGHKLSFQWKSPRRIVDANLPNVYVVENLQSGNRELVHTRRLCLCKSAMDSTEVSHGLRKAA